VEEEHGAGEAVDGKWKMENGRGERGDAEFRMQNAEWKRRRFIREWRLCRAEGLRDGHEVAEC
jgi:hypothetical protein